MNLIKKWRGIVFWMTLFAVLILAGFNENFESEAFKDKEFKVGAYYFEDYTYPIDEVIPWNQIDYLCYAFLIPNEDGTIKKIRYPDKLKDIIKKAKNDHVKVFISVGGWSYNDTLLDLIFGKIMADKITREAFADNLMDFVKEYEIDGIDMDWEYPKPGNSAKNFELFMMDLSSKLKKENKLLAAAVIGSTKAQSNYTGEGVSDKVIAALDLINIMCYDLSLEGIHSPMSYAETSIAYWTSRAPKEKISLGVGFYTRPGGVAYRNLIKDNSSYAVIDKASHSAGNPHVYYSGMPHIERKTSLALEKAGGIFAWEINMDARNEYSLMDVIYRTVEGSKKGYVHQVSIVINDKMVNFNDDLGQPFIDEHDRILIPVRKLGEVMNYKVSYDDKKREAKIQTPSGGDVLTIPLLKNYLYVNESRVNIDTESVIRNGRVYIPFRAFFETFDYDVEWDSEISTAYANEG